jgi:hypothetical protein
MKPLSDVDLPSDSEMGIDFVILSAVETLSTVVELLSDRVRELFSDPSSVQASPTSSRPCPTLTDLCPTLSDFVDSVPLSDMTDLVDVV